ncbi:proline-rich receptor-like kinase [Rhynchospora pubera]|uniref:Proline-rich receptor-like kinase n=1 Tax=Rhynchospora pubera TaxID=906938 RepID=A0AAV8E3I2_9POAL|nr:proline-rich receptor-like kinase [Rhynchospora pubera]
MPYYAERARRTSCLIWTAAIFCAIIATAVIIAGLVILVIYLIYQPKSPYLKMGNAQLIHLYYDQAGTLDTELQITIMAENDNTKTDAAFYSLSLDLLFQSVTIAQLQAADFVVPTNSSVPLGYDVQSTPVPLDPVGMSAMDSALKNRQIPFYLTGRARTRWRLGSLYSTLLFPPKRLENGDVVPFDIFEAQKLEIKPVGKIPLEFPKLRD